MELVVLIRIDGHIGRATWPIHLLQFINIRLRALLSSLYLIYVHLAWDILYDLYS